MMRPGFSERRGDFHKGQINVSILISSISTNYTYFTIKPRAL